MKICKYVLLDFDGLPIRYYTYPALGTVKVVEKKFNYKDYEEALF